MPVPVSRPPKAPAHPVFKDSHISFSSHGDQARSLYPFPVLPAVGSRAQLHSERRLGHQLNVREAELCQPSNYNRPHFLQGLTAADNATVIKGACAQACPPPELADLVQQTSTDPYTFDVGPDEDDEMAIDYSDFYPSYGAVAPLADNATNMEMAYLARKHEWGTFTPILEDQSPLEEQKMLSSPIEPITPFGEFVDRAFSETQSYMDSGRDMIYCGPALRQERSEEPKAQPEYVVTPSATESYKRLAQPLSEWVANYVWKVCATGMGLSQSRFSATQVVGLAGPPPTYLAESIHSMLLSTLLQPSAVFLALWYITRLPVFFGATGMGADRVKELRFRVALLGDSRDRAAMESGAPFRLVILGCMLANKWLDDHTFSNKTWHTISNLPIQDINRLEALALDIFSYDLSISRAQWSQLLDHLLAYHQSLSSPLYPQPISRPSTNPHSIIRKAIDDVLYAPSFGEGNINATGPQPIFLGLDQRRAEKARKECTTVVCVLDEDGPLRQEYIPKRRISDSSSIYSNASSGMERFESYRWSHNKQFIADNALPPPAKWSPAGDEPIARERGINRTSQGTIQPQYGCITSHYHAGIPAARDMISHGLCWSATCGAAISKAPPYMPSWQPIGSSVRPAPLMHARSQSLLSCDQQSLAMHSRSYSQSHFDYKFSNIRSTANACPPINTSWSMSFLYGPPASIAPPYADAQFPSSWVRA